MLCQYCCPWKCITHLQWQTGKLIIQHLLHFLENGARFKLFTFWNTYFNMHYPFHNQQSFLLLFSIYTKRLSCASFRYFTAQWSIWFLKKNASMFFFFNFVWWKQYQKVNVPIFYLFLLSVLEQCFPHRMGRLILCPQWIDPVR